MLLVMKGGNAASAHAMAMVMQERMPQRRTDLQ
jgi:hypothetical protein